MRINQQRPDFKIYKDNLTPEQIDSLINLLDNYLSAVIENIDDVEKVKELSMNYGLKHVNLRLNGFKPDFFAAMADAIATECSFLSETATTHAPTNTFRAWTLLVDLMFSSVRDGFYQELRRQRRQSPTHLKSLGESNVSNFCPERDYCTNYDQAITASNTSLIEQSLSTTDTEEQDVTNHRTSLLTENISNHGTIMVTTVSNPLFHRSTSINSLPKLLSTTSSGSMDSRKHIMRSRTPIPNPTTGRFFKNPNAGANYEFNKYQNFKQFSSQSSLSTPPKPFDPNKIIDDFMNDRYKI